MSKEQIDNMAKDLCRLDCSCKECLHSKYSKSSDKCAARMYAERAYKKNYRKQKKGEWVSYISPVCLSGDLYYKCSICGTNDPYQLTTKRAKYCPNCGAHMKGGAE